MLLLLQVNCPNSFYSLKNISFCLLAINQAVEIERWVSSCRVLVNQKAPPCILPSAWRCASGHSEMVLSPSLVIRGSWQPRASPQPNSPETTHSVRLLCPSSTEKGSLSLSFFLFFFKKNYYYFLLKYSWFTKLC